MADSTTGEKSTRTVIVGAVQTKSGQSGDRKWRRYALVDPDDRFVASTFSGTIGKFLQEHEGQKIEIDIVEKPGSEGGTLRDLVDAREIPQNAPERSQEAPVGSQVRHSAIVKEVALKAAVEYAKVMKEAPDVEQLLLVGGKFEAWINGESEESPDKDGA